MSALVWSVESVLLGVWALLLSLNSTSFHSFIACSHVVIAGITLILQLIAAARDLPIKHAVSESFACAVTALALVYTAAILDTDNHPRFFSMSSAGGMLPIDAVIGIAWFCAAVTSATGMALSGVKQSQDQRAALMFHQYGYHMSVVLPSLFMLWLYNYDAKNKSEPVYKGIQFVVNNDITITHTILFIVYTGLWGWFVVTQFLGEGFLTMGSEWPSWKNISSGTLMLYMIASILKFLGRCGCVLIPLSAALTAHTFAQTVMAWSLTGIAAIYATDIMSVVDHIVGVRKSETMDSPTAPVMIESEFVTPQQLNEPIYSERKTPYDPAAVILNSNISPQTPSLIQMLASKSPQLPLSQWRRDKMV
jgi:hypothetical protein